ncbi:hypothetical protein IJ596_01075 [bacterium]|nr:hypothetical protein [bacterium]
MQETLRKRINKGLYDEKFERLLCQGFSFNKIREISGVSNYALEICKWHLYHKYKVWNRRDLVVQIKNTQYVK